MTRVTAGSRPASAATRRALPPALGTAVDSYERHLGAERGLSGHTVRGYVADAVSLLDHGMRMGIAQPADLDIHMLRSWLARLRSAGAARSSLARRAAGTRSFTAWGQRTGLFPDDVGRLLASPKPHRPLPAVLRQAQARELVEFSAGEGEPDVLSLRDRVVLELLYGTGVRVGELCGVDLDHVDGSRRLLRVLGKGGKERSVPYGVPAQRAIDTYLSQGRPALAVAGSGPALLLGARGGRIDPRAVRRVVHQRLAGVPGAPDLGPHGLALRCDPPA